MEERDFMFDAYNNQRRVPILQESVYVAINLTIKTAKVVFRVIAIMHWLRAKRGLGRRQERSRRPRSPRFSEISRPHRLDPCI